MTKDLIDAIRGRRSVRRFTSAPIPDPTIGRILECGRLAPSAGNVEPWFFYVVKNSGIKEQIAGASESWVAGAPVVLVVTADFAGAERAFGERGKDVYIFQDTAAATQNILLAAYGFGIGSCWVGKLDEGAIQRILGLPENERPVAVIPLGYPADAEPAAVPHKALDEIVKIIH